MSDTADEWKEIKKIQDAKNCSVGVCYYVVLALSRELFNYLAICSRMLEVIRLTIMLVGHGGALVESIAFNRRVVGSTPALAAM